MQALAETATRPDHGDIYVGTSGWSYDHWRGPFYARDLPDSAMLQAYSRHFRTVEINNSFYRLPVPDTVERWRETVPPGFVFSVKASRFITHMKKMLDPESTTRSFFDRISAFDDRLGPILFQLPPHWSVNASRLEAFLAELPSNHRYAFEFRDPSWFGDRVFELLRKVRVALCVYDLGGFNSPEELTADFVYVRMHGPVHTYSGSYDDETLSKWAGKLGAWSAEGRDVFCYFNNDVEGYAVENAARLSSMLGITWPLSPDD